jgi:hypothetical protein
MFVAVQRCVGCIVTARMSVQSFLRGSHSLYEVDKVSSLPTTSNGGRTIASLAVVLITPLASTALNVVTDPVPHSLSPVA